MAIFDRGVAPEYGLGVGICVVCCPSQEQAEGAHNEAIRALARLRLKVNPAKTRIVSPKEPLEWLGVVIK